MSALFVAAVIAAIVPLAIIKFRVPAALVFFSLLVGQLLSQQVSDDVYYFVGSMFSGTSHEWVRPLLLLIPIVLTLLFLRGSVSRSKMFFEIVPALLTGLTTVILLMPQLPSLRNQLSDNDIWQTVELYKSLVIFTASLASLITCWFTFSKHHRG